MQSEGPRRTTGRQEEKEKLGAKKRKEKNGRKTDGEKENAGRKLSVLLSSGQLSSGKERGKKNETFDFSSVL